MYLLLLRLPKGWERPPPRVMIWLIFHVGNGLVLLLSTILWDGYRWFLLSCRPFILIRGVVDGISISVIRLPSHHFFLILQVRLFERLQFLFQVKGCTLRLLGEIDMVNGDWVVDLDHLALTWRWDLGSYWSGGLRQRLVHSSLVVCFGPEIPSWTHLDLGFRLPLTRDFGLFFHFSRFT